MRADDVTREQVEDFMYLEAEMLDEWRLKEWLGLFTADGAYYVPTTARQESGDVPGVVFSTAELVGEG